MRAFLTLFAAAIITAGAWAQSPSKMSYQAVIRNTSNQLVTNQPIGMRVSILQGSISGTVVYTEIQATTTNANGLVSIEIGGGAGFYAIDWANGPFFIKTETDPGGGANYTITNTSQLLSVPYALHSKTADALAGGIIETDPVFTASPANDINSVDISNWNTSYGWGNHANAGYLTGFTEADPIFTSSPSKEISSTHITNWNTAFDWGNHSNAGYLKSFTETDPVFGVSPANGISSTHITNWNTAYNWGDHANAGYLKGFTETDPLWTSASVNYFTRANMQTSGTAELHFNNLTNKPTTLAGYGITDADGSSTNEIQQLSLAGNDLTLSKGGGTVILPSYSGDNWGTQSVLTDATLSGNGTTVTPLKIAQQAATTGQVLKWSGSAWVPGTDQSGSSLWMQDGSNIYYNTGKVGIGTATPQWQLDVAGSINLPTDSVYRIQGYPVLSTKGNGNTLIGKGAGKLMTNDAESNTAIGSAALYNNSIRGDNVAVGDSALYNNNSTDEIYYFLATCNTAVGSRALFSNTTGYHNTAIGKYALYSNQNGIDNTAIGNGTLQHNNTGDWNTAIGSGALYSNTVGSKNTAIGVDALDYNTSGDGNVAIGHSALTLNSTGNLNVAIGSDALYHNTTGTYNTATGYGALLYNETGGSNVANGFGALYHNTSGHENTANGRDALFNNTTGYYNVAIGSTALYHNTTGYFNTANGNGALYSNTTGCANVAIGTSALYSNTTANKNIAIGNGALSEQSADLGEDCISNNVAIGNSALSANQLSLNGSWFLGVNNTAVGNQSLWNNISGYNNTAIGYLAFPGRSGYFNSTALGSNTPITASNQVRIGDSYVTSIGGYVNWTSISDSRFKKGIQENVPGLDFIMKLNPVTYFLDMNKIAEYQHTPDSDRLRSVETLQSSMPQTGFIAQEVEQAAQSVGFNFSGVDVPKNENDIYGLRYAEFVVPLVKAIQEQQEIIVELKQSNVEMKKLIEQLLIRIEQLEEK